MADNDIKTNDLTVTIDAWKKIRFEEIKASFASCAVAVVLKESDMQVYKKVLDSHAGAAMEYTFTLSPDPKYRVGFEEEMVARGLAFVSALQEELGTSAQEDGRDEFKQQLPDTFVSDKESNREVEVLKHQETTNEFQDEVEALKQQLLDKDKEKNEEIEALKQQLQENEMQSNSAIEVLKRQFHEKDEKSKEQIRTLMQQLQEKEEKSNGEIQVLMQQLQEKDKENNECQREIAVIRKLYKELRHREQRTTVLDDLVKEAREHETLNRTIKHLTQRAPSAELVCNSVITDIMEFIENESTSAPPTSATLSSSAPNSFVQPVTTRNLSNRRPDLSDLMIAKENKRVVFDTIHAIKTSTAHGNQTKFGGDVGEDEGDTALKHRLQSTIQELTHRSNRFVEEARERAEPIDGENNNGMDSASKVLLNQMMVKLIQENYCNEDLDVKSSATRAVLSFLCKVLTGPQALSLNQVTLALGPALSEFIWLLDIEESELKDEVLDVFVEEVLGDAALDLELSQKDWQSVFGGNFTNPTQESKHHRLQTDRVTTRPAESNNASNGLILGGRSNTTKTPAAVAKGTKRSGGASKSTSPVTSPESTWPGISPNHFKTSPSALFGGLVADKKDDD